MKRRHFIALTSSVVLPVWAAGSKKELQRTDAKLVFATTTPIPEDCPGAIVYLDQEAYNEPARKLMKEQGIVVNDLYAFARPRLKELQIPANVHFSAYGSEQLARQNFNVLSPLLK